MPNQITKKQAVTTIAGSARRNVIEVLSTSAPLVNAPMITPSSSAATRNAAALRVSRVWAPDSAVRRWLIATSSGSHTTYAPCTAQPHRKVVNAGAKGRIQEPRAWKAVGDGSTLGCPEL